MTTTIGPSPSGRLTAPPPTESTRPRDEHRVELEWIGNGAWRACDVTVPPDDATCLIAYVECRADCVEVTWVRPFRPMSSFESLREAYTAVSRAL